MHKLKTWGAVFAIPAAIAVAILSGEIRSTEDLVTGSYRGGYYQSAGSVSAMTPVDTLDFLIRDSTFPNSQIVTGDPAGYDYVLADTSEVYEIFVTGTGTGPTDNGPVRWGYVDKADSLNVQAEPGPDSDFRTYFRTYGNEDNNVWPADQEFAFVWFDISDLEQGQRVEEAFIVINSGNNTTIDANEKLWARADTISKDYRILDGTSAGFVGSNDDYGRFCASWVELDESKSLAWEPSLNRRTDYHDYGPRSDTFVDMGTAYSIGEPMRFEVTDALQQVLDNGESARGVLFLIYGTASSASFMNFGSGNSATVGSSRKGNPVMYGRVTSNRGSRPWGGVRVPVSMTLDAGWPGQRDFWEAFFDSGLTFDVALDSFMLNQTNRQWIPDSVYVNVPGSLDYQTQGTRHYSLGAVGPNILANEMSRDWWPGEFDSSFDTLSIIDWAWGSGVDSTGIGGTSPYYKDKAAVYAMIANGYRSARDGGGEWTVDAEGFNGRVPFSWENYSHLYIMRGLGMQFVMTDSATVPTGPATQVQIEERMGDYVDKYYTNYGKSAIFMYGHKQITGEFLTGDNFRYLIGLSRSKNWFTILPHREIIGRRLSGFVAPSVVKTSIGWTQKDSTVAKTLATMQDSLYSIEGDGNQLLEMWITPR